MVGNQPGPCSPAYLKIQSVTPFKDLKVIDLSKEGLFPMTGWLPFMHVVSCCTQRNKIKVTANIIPAFMI